jgi:NAD(P)-dependent dehydrogenase (short-subunit alcohol dehydrogenase family)
MNDDLQGTVALVTGALGDIGQAIGAALGARGVRVITSDIRSDGPPDTLILDVTSESDWRRVINGIRRDHGRLDVLVNCAGVAPVARIEDVTLAEWRACQAVNVDGILLGMKTAVPLLAESGAQRRGGSSIVNISSAGADRGVAMTAAYCTSKAAATMLSRAAAVEFAALGYPVRVNAVHPGPVESTMMSGIFADYSRILGGVPIADLEAGLTARVPLGRLMQPDEVADVVTFLASSASRFVHGTQLNCDGGYTA